MKQISFFSPPHRDLFWGSGGGGHAKSLQDLCLRSSGHGQKGFLLIQHSLAPWGWMGLRTHTEFLLDAVFVHRQIFPKGLKAFYGHYLTYPPQSPGRWREGRGSQQYRVGHQSETHKACFKRYQWASLVVQWLRICLPTKGTRVWSLVQQDPTCRRAPKPMHCSYWSPCA